MQCAIIPFAQAGGLKEDLELACDEAVDKGSCYDAWAQAEREHRGRAPI